MINYKGMHCLPNKQKDNLKSQSDSTLTKDKMGLSGVCVGGRGVWAVVCV